MTFAQNASLGLETRFKVTVDDINLGGWHSCKGLAVKFNLEPLEEGGEYGFKHWLPGCVEYSHITLERAMIAADAGNVQNWLASKIDNHTGGTGSITLLDSRGQKVYTWTLRGVRPMSWKGPNLEATSGKVATEVLELAHEGFLGE